MVAIDGLEVCVRLTTCLKLPALKAGTRSSHRLRLRKVSRVKYTYRSMAIETPTTNIKASGYRNSPPSLKKLTTEFIKFICALLDNAHPLRTCDSTRFRKIGYDLLLTLLPRLGRCTILGRVCLHGVVINDLALEHVPIDGCQNFIYQTVHGLARQIADIRPFPGDDIHDFRLLSVPRHGGRTQFQPINFVGRRLLARPSPPRPPPPSPRHPPLPPAP